MLSSMNALGGYSLTKSDTKTNNIFNEKHINLLRNTKHTTRKKRNFSEVGQENDSPTKAKRAVRDRDTLKIRKLWNPTIIKLKQKEKDTLEAITTGLHPDLTTARDGISKLGFKLRKVEEQGTFWKHKTMKVQEQLRRSKNNAADLNEKVVKLEIVRVLLQNKVTAAEEESTALSDAMKSLISENNELNDTISNMDKELSSLMEDEAKFDVRVTDNSNSVMLVKALEDTMANLSDRITEIEDLKNLLASVTVEKDLLAKQVVTKQMIPEIVDEDEDENEKVIKLQNAVEKCMFRIAVLTQKNEELERLNGEAVVSSDEDTRLANLLGKEEELSSLESVCMKRYRRILKQAAEKLIAQESMNESFIN